MGTSNTQNTVPWDVLVADQIGELDTSMLHAPESTERNGLAAIYLRAAPNSTLSRRCP